MIQNKQAQPLDALGQMIQNQQASNLGWANYAQQADAWMTNPDNPNALHPALIPGSLQSTEVNPLRIIAARVGNMMGLDGTGTFLPSTRPGLGMSPEKIAAMTPEEWGATLGRDGQVPGMEQFDQNMEHYRNVTAGLAPGYTAQDATAAQNKLGPARVELPPSVNDAVHTAVVSLEGNRHG